MWPMNQQYLLYGSLQSLPTPDVDAKFFNKIAIKLSEAIYKSIKYTVTKSTQREVRWGARQAEAG